MTPVRHTYNSRDKKSTFLPFFNQKQCYFFILTEGACETFLKKIRDGDPEAQDFLKKIKDTVNEALIIAVQANDVPAVEMLLKHHADVNCCDEFGNPLFHEAIKLIDDCKFEDSVTSYLMSAGAQVDAVNNAGESSLHIAARHENYAAVKYLLKKGANIYHVNNFGQSIINYSVHLDDFNCRILDYIWKNGFWDLNAQDVNGNTILHNFYRDSSMGTMSCNNFVSCIMWGASIYIKNFKNESPHYKCFCYDMGIDASNCNLTYFIAIMSILNVPFFNDFMDLYQSVDRCFYVADDILPQLIEELDTLKEIIIPYSRKLSMYELLFADRTTLCKLRRNDKYIQIVKGSNKQFPILCQLFYVNMMKGAKRDIMIKKCQTVFSEILGSSQYPAHCMEKIFHFISNSELLKLSKFVLVTEN